jgi:hypothetical protein
VLAQPPLHLLNVLAGVRRGRVAYLCLTPTQVRELRDPDGRIALDVLRHLLGARPMTPERFPLTEEALQGVARRLGYVVGQKRCRRMVKRLLASDVIARCGQYRQPFRNPAVRSGFCVGLYKLGQRLRAPRLAERKHPVGISTAVKTDFRPRWWQHPLFGDILGLPPPDIPARARRRMKSLDELFQSRDERCSPNWGCFTAGGKAGATDLIALVLERVDAAHLLAAVRAYRGHVSRRRVGIVLCAHRSLGLTRSKRRGDPAGGGTQSLTARGRSGRRDRP